MKSLFVSKIHPAGRAVRIAAALLLATAVAR